MPSAIRSITVDCHDPHGLAQFWVQVTGYTLKAWDAEGALLVRSDGQLPRLLFLRVPESKMGKNRMHLDLTPESTMQAEVDRLTGLGARVLRLVEEEGSRFTVMHDPEGNEFCVESGPGDR